jgi:signal peptidase I
MKKNLKENKQLSSKIEHKEGKSIFASLFKKKPKLDKTEIEKLKVDLEKFKKESKEKLTQEKNIFKKYILWRKVKKGRKKLEKQIPQPPLLVIWSWIKTLVGAFIIVTIINGLALASFVVPTGSMKNTVLEGDFLFVNKFIYGPSSPQVIPFLNKALPYFRFPAFRNPKKNDVIVFIFPGNRWEIRDSNYITYYLKRCIATAGDTINYYRDSLNPNRAHLFVNGIEYEKPEYGRYESHSIIPDSMETFPPGEILPFRNTRDNYHIRVPKKGDTIYFNGKNFINYAVFIAREDNDVSFIFDSAYTAKPTNAINRKFSKGQHIKLEDFCKIAMQLENPYPDEPVLNYNYRNFISNVIAQKVFINGQETNYYVVQKDYCFGMGDNRDGSLDSRYWGFIPYDLVVGTPIMIYFSWELRPEGTPPDPRFEYSLLKKISKIRWSRLFKFIN